MIYPYTTALKSQYVPIFRSDHCIGYKMNTTAAMQRESS